jgi:hypothetical protein
MKNKALYITVRLDVEYNEKISNWKDTKEIVMNECDYYFKISNFEDIKITNTEICGESE